MSLPLPLPMTPLAEPGEERPLVFDTPRRGRPPVHWLDLSVSDRLTAVGKLGLPGYRAKQISAHVFSRHELDPLTWSDLPAVSRQQLAKEFFPQLLTPVQELTADRGLTIKDAWRLHDGSLVESVLMRYPGTAHSSARNTLCISSQAGCGMACPFCATGQGGLQRNLSAGEILAQVADAQARLSSGELSGGAGRLNNVVFMGMGEPMANYHRVLDAVRTMIAPEPDGFGMSARGITISTVGLVPQILRLTEEGLPVTLAVSLHAPDDGLRDELIPVNQRWKVGELLDAAYGYFEKTRRRVSIEYALIRDINDQSARADELARQLKARGVWRGPGKAAWVHVNLIPLNPTPGSKWTASRTSDQQTFISRLESAGIPVTLRDTRGSDIDGACGQLAAVVSGLTAN